MKKEFATTLLLNSPGKVKITHPLLNGNYLYSDENHKIFSKNGELYSIGEALMEDGWEIVR